MGRATGSWGKMRAAVRAAGRPRAGPRASEASNPKESDHDETDARGAGGPDSTGSGAHDQVAGADLRSDTPVRSPDLELPVLRPGRGRGQLDVGAIPGAPADRSQVRHPLRDAVVAPGQPL